MFTALLKGRSNDKTVYNVGAIASLCTPLDIDLFLDSCLQIKDDVYCVQNYLNDLLLLCEIDRE